MAQENLGLFDTRPNRTEIRISLAIVALVFITLLVTLPLQNVYLGVVPGFVPTINAAMLVCDLITAAILYAQAAVFRSRALTALASGYLLAGLLMIPYGLSYPGAFSATGLLGAKVNTTGWIAACWRLSVPAAIVIYAWLKRADLAAGPVAERPPIRILPRVLGAIALALLITFMTTIGHDLLPPFFINQSVVVRPTLVALNVTVLAVTITAMVILLRQKKSVLDLWLLVSMSAWVGQSFLNTMLQSRYSFGAYIFLGLVFASTLIVMLALIAESNRLYARLALSTAARERERDARLMSMDAVAAAIAHEVGQPLSATKLSASAALGWLARSEPDAEKAIVSLHDTLDSNARTFDVIRSIRATFAPDAAALSEFSLSELVRQTVSLMDRELAARKVSLQLSLDDRLPPVLANKVQIQRVLINLLTNAIESLAATNGRARNIAIWSAPANAHHQIVNVSDSGIGISPEKMAQIFEPFFTTKSTGTGLGLSLSRTIIEEHGGRLWASSHENQGATFHVEMRDRPDSA